MGLQSTKTHVNKHMEKENQLVLFLMESIKTLLNSLIHGARVRIMRATHGHIQVFFITNHASFHAFTLPLRTRNRNIKNYAGFHSVIHSVRASKTTCYENDDRPCRIMHVERSIKNFQ